MNSIIELLTHRVAAAVDAAVGDRPDAVDPQVRRSQDERFGDYQSNIAMPLAKLMGVKPRDLAARIVEKLKIDDICEPPELAGPGFINLRLRPAFLAAQLASIPPVTTDREDRLGIEKTTEPTVVAVDMSSPNLAKEMHVGHLRSTIIGDCIARILEFAGHEVHRINHVGDWGTQFGMLLAYLRRTQPKALDRAEDLVLNDLEQFYIQAKALYDSDPAFADQSRKTVVELQREDPAVMAVWRAFCEESLRHCHAIYESLDVRLEDRGESFYRSMLGDVVKSFEEKGLAVESKGATCVFLDGFTSRDGDPLPMMIRKSDGAYNYHTSDLAAVRHRIETLGARRLIYVVGIPQKQHFEMLFAAVKKIGWSREDVTLRHIGFGSLLGPNGRPFKTSTGGSVKLKDLLDEAVARARKVIEEGIEKDEKRAAFDETTISEIAHAVGIGAMKYFDLSHSLSADYKFDWDTMLAMDGNTAPYLLYAYARVRSIGRKAEIDFAELPADAPITIEHQSEVRLAKVLCRFRETLDHVAAELKPNVLTEYLYELSKAFSLFYDRRLGVRVIDAETDALRTSRLRLCDITARTLKLGLSLLGIRTVEKM